MADLRLLFWAAALQRVSMTAGSLLPSLAMAQSVLVRLCIAVLHLLSCSCARSLEDVGHPATLRAAKQSGSCLPVSATVQGLVARSSALRSWAFWAAAMQEASMTTGNCLPALAVAQSWCVTP